MRTKNNRRVIDLGGGLLDISVQVNPPMVQHHGQGTEDKCPYCGSDASYFIALIGGEPATADRCEDCGNCYNIRPDTVTK